MSVLVVGLNHRSAPTELLEAVSMVGDELRKALSELATGEHVGEGLVLATCNRVEVYADVATFHGGVAEISDLLARVSGLPLAELTGHLYVHHDGRAVQHIFSVACGLDSMLIGEPQILGQLRSAFNVARDEGTTGRVLGELVSNALRVGKRAQSETGIGRAGASLVTLAVADASAWLGNSAGNAAGNSAGNAAGNSAARDGVDGLAGLSGLVIGAGATGGLAAAALRRHGIGSLSIANRTPVHGDRLAESYEATVVALADLVPALAGADIVVTTTGATGQIVSHADVLAAVAGRDPSRPLVIIDLAMPRDVAPAVREIVGVRLTDLDDIRGLVESALVAVDVDTVRDLLVTEVADFQAWQRSNAVAPTVVALRSKAEAVVRDELTRLAGRLPDLSAGDRAEVEQSVRRVVDKLLHAPTVRVKELAAGPNGDAYAEALRELFGLDRHAAEAVSAPTPGEVA